MDEMTVFEQRFEDRVRRFALTGVRPVDAAGVARAVAVGHRDRGAASSVRWSGLPLDRSVWTIGLALVLLAALLGGALLVGARLLLSPPLDVASTVTNGWIAFTVGQSGPDSTDDDLDIWLVSLDRDARRVVGSDTDRVQQLCPAFSRDGRSLAYGRVEGRGTDYFMNDDGTEGSEPASYRHAALVVADVSDDGRVSDRITIDVGDGLPPPCPVWSPDGERLAFSVPRTSPINPDQSSEGSEVWVVRLSDREVTVLPDLLATDLEWSPDGDLLAIASGEQGLVRGEILQDGRIRLYEPASGALRSLDTTRGAAHLTWSPRGRLIAYMTGDSVHDLRVIDVGTGTPTAMTEAFGALHGIGPVWSPDGATIVYQRGLRGEHSEAVLLTPGDPSAGSAGSREAVVPETAAGSGERLDPYWVTWSPDGQYLLMMGWGHPPDTTGTVEDPFLVAIPVDPAMPSRVLYRMDGLVVNDGYPDTTVMPIQTWGRSP